MKRLAHHVEVTLSFDGLTLSEVAALESFIDDGFGQNKDWGTPGIKIDLTPTGVKEEKKGKEAMTSKKILELEKEGGKK
jgi:hypothetical protein